MYDIQKFLNGINLLGINDIEEICALWYNHFIKTPPIKITHRFYVPFGSTKKEYTKLLSNNQKEIEHYRNLSRLYPEMFNDILASYIERKKKIKNYMENKNTVELDKEKAKEYPIDKIIDFNPKGFCKCMFHEDKNPSMYFYKNSNRVHCFSCGRSWDAIDIVMKVYNLSFRQALLKLC